MSRSEELNEYQLQIGTFQGKCQFQGIANDWTTKAFAICLYRDWTPCCCSCWPSSTPGRVQGGGRHSVLQGIWWDRSLDTWMLLGTGFMISILASPVTSDPHDLQKTFCKLRISWYWAPPSPKPYILTSSTAALEQTLRALWDATSRAAVRILPQIKLNSQLSSCTSFLSWHEWRHLNLFPHQ